MTITPTTTATRVRHLLLTLELPDLATVPEGYAARGAEGEGLSSTLLEEDVRFTLDQTAGGAIGDPEAHELYGSTGIVVRALHGRPLVVDSGLDTLALAFVLHEGHGGVDPDGEPAGEPPWTLHDELRSVAQAAVSTFLVDQHEALAALGVFRDTNAERTAALYADDEPF